MENFDIEKTKSNHLLLLLFNTRNYIFYAEINNEIISLIKHSMTAQNIIEPAQSPRY